jgi:Xaa-Pro aminopeptidase
VSRLERLATRLDRPLLVTKSVNVLYLTGLESSNAAALVEPSGETTLYTDFRYAESARQIPDVTFVETGRYLIRELAVLLAGGEITCEAEHLSVASFETLRGGGVAVAPTTGIVEALRSVKDDSEVAALKRAAALSDQVYDELSRQPFIGRTETELAWWVDRRFRELGASGSSFDTIVAFGEMAARPHGHPRDDVSIPPGPTVIVDAGCIVDGYCSDCTRTFLTDGAGRDAARRILELYELCAQAQRDGLAATQPGAHGRDVDAASRVAIGAAGLKDAYGHGLGHGVGLEIHEAPVLRPESDDTLQPGNVVTVEPGIYLAGDLGIRIEDLVLVTEDGCERLTTFTKEPLTVG